MGKENCVDFGEGPLQARFTIDRATNAFVPASPIAPGDTIEGTGHGEVVIVNPERVKKMWDEAFQAALPEIVRIARDEERGVGELKKLGPFA